MRFTQSERTLHPGQRFTPPCNYYNANLQNNNIKTGSLFGPTVAKEQPNFGLSSRFNGKLSHQKAPGPGSYFNEKGKSNQKNLVKAGAVVRQYKKHGFLGGEERSPSIPYTQFKLDQEDQKFVKQLQMGEDLNKSSLAAKKRVEGYTFSRSPRHADKASTIHVDEQPIPLETIAEYAQKVKRLNAKPKVNMRQQLQKTNERRAQIMNMMNPEFTPSLELIELITKRRTKFTPGPGNYNCFKDQPPQLQSGITFSMSKRFSQDKRSIVGPGRYQIFDDDKKKNVSFSKSNRNLFDLKEQTDLEHRFYIDPYAGLKKREQVSTKGQSQPFSFGSQVTRFSKIQKQLPKEQEISIKSRRQSKIESVVQMRLQKMYLNQKRNTKESEGLLGISTMASTIQ